MSPSEANHYELSERQIADEAEAIIEANNGEVPEAITTEMADVAIEKYLDPEFGPLDEAEYEATLPHVKADLARTLSDIREGRGSLAGHLRTNAQGALQKASERNFWAAFEEFYVGMCVCRMAMHTRPAELTPERIELTARLAWAQSELEGGSGARVKDDLENVRELAEGL